MAKTNVEHVQVAPGDAGRRIDNYLTGLLKDVPKTRIYRMLRKGEVRVNGGRIRQDYRLKEWDILRIPPFYQGSDRGRGGVAKPSVRLQEVIRDNILYEDEGLLAINKPAGIAVHAGSGEQLGVIEVMRFLRPACPTLELVHRLDKLTSGCLLLAKDHRYLRELHEILRQNQVRKHYIALLFGHIPHKLEISLPLRKNRLRSGEHMVQIDVAGKPAKTFVDPQRKINGATLVQIEIATGRTHQIRVHAAQCGHPVAGDPKYGDRDFNRILKRAGLHRMFLHAEALVLTLPQTGKTTTIRAPMPDELENFLEKYCRRNATGPG
ncbi:MAG: RluA family pseudouridine synthase [Gammaproteobacteria bacterium]